MHTDEQLVKKTLKGDITAFDELVARYQKKVMNISYGMVSDYHDACDAVQEVFLRVYKNLSSFKGEAQFSTWIYRITANVCNDLLRKRKKNTAISLDRDDENSARTDIPDDGATPHDAAERSEIQSAVRKAVAGLPDDYRTVLTLYEFENLSYEQIAKILKCPMGTVKSRINRAKKALRKKLEEKRELFL